MHHGANARIRRDLRPTCEPVRRWDRFPSELTGRENIFSNGAILGMAKAEIKHKFDEIVAFAEIEKFLDTPVNAWVSH